MMESIAFYVRYKSRGLIMPCNADDLCLFIGTLVPEGHWSLGDIGYITNQLIALGIKSDLSHITYFVIHKWQDQQFKH